MGPLSGTGARLTAACVLLSAAAVSCASPGASAPGAGGQTVVTGPPPSPSAAATPVRMTNGTPTPTDTAIPTTPVPAGCPSGTVAITHSAAETDTSTVCIKAGAQLRLTLIHEGIGGWTALRVAPDGAATVTSTTDPENNEHAMVTPTGTAPFCLSTDTTDPTAPAASWRLCVTVRR
jgi:hypothetical protein